MVEREVPPSAPESADSPWDIPGATSALQAERTPHVHPVYGPGERLTLVTAPGPIKPRIDLYPQQLFARYRDNLARIELRSVGTITAAEGRVTLLAGAEATPVRLMLSADGSLGLAGPALNQPGLPGLSDAPSSEGPRPESPSVREAEAPEALSSPSGAESPAGPPALPEPASQPETQPRLTLLGRIGAVPSFRTTARGGLVCRFPLAVHDDEGGTTWETVLVFGPRAEKLRGALSKGQQAEVVGYVHERSAPTRDGSTKTIRELYAVAVRGR